MNKILLVIGIFFLVGLSYLIGINIFKNTSLNPSDRPEFLVSASFYPLYFFASQIGGEKAEVINITPFGVEPHEYDPTPQDRIKIEKSKLLILNGNFETWGNKIKDDLKSIGVFVVIAGDGLFAQNDPHIWLSPQKAKTEVEKIREGYDQADPQNSAFYDENAKNLMNRLDQLDLTFKNGLGNCRQKDFITAHNAFGYLASAYNLNQVPIAGFSPDSEPSAQQLAKISKFAKENNIKYIFFESLVSPKLSETLASEIGAQILVLDPLEGLSDNDIKLGKNYFTVMEDNLKNLQKALLCTNQTT